MVVSVGDAADAVGIGGDETIFGVPGVGPETICEQVAVAIIVKRGGVDGSVLVEVVGRVGVCV